MRIDKLLKQTAAKLAPDQGARLDAELLLCHVLEKPRSFLYAHPEFIVNTQAQIQIEQLLERRIVGEPLAYIIGYKEFWSLKLQVDRRVLVPRPETEEMVEQVLQLALPDQAVVADLGTGSGAIALALAVEKPQWQVLAIEYSADAVCVAAANIRSIQQQHARLQQAGQPALLRASWLSACVDNVFDLLVANPPYIDDNDPHLLRDGLPYEPAAALVSGSDGYADIDAIITQARRCLKPNGFLAIEHGYQQSEQVVSRLADSGYQDMTAYQDLAGNARFVIARNAA